MTQKQLRNQISIHATYSLVTIVSDTKETSVCQHVWLPAAFRQLKIGNLRCQNIKQELQKCSPLGFWTGNIHLLLNVL